MLGPALVEVLAPVLAPNPIRPNVLDDGDDLPGVVYDVESVTSVDCLTGPSGKYQATFLVESISRLRDEAEGLDEAARAALLSWSGEAGGVINEGLLFIGAGDEAGWTADADETPVYRSSSRYRLLFEMAR